MTTPYHGKWFEQLEVGLVVRHALTRTITETDNILFTTMSMNRRGCISTPSTRRATEFGRPLVNSMFTVALLVGISVLETTHGTTIANLGFGEIAFPAPVFCGDTIHAETTVVAARASSSRPEQGIVTFEHRAFNQRDVLVCTARRNALMVAGGARLAAAAGVAMTRAATRAGGR